MRHSYLVTLALLSGISAALAGQAAPPNPAGDWPQWRGPERNGISRETGLLKSWPAAGPPVVWSVDNLGTGYGGISTKADRIFVQGSDGKQSFVTSLIRATGKTVWVKILGQAVANGQGNGPRGTPTVDGDRVYVLTENGDLACLAVRDGAIVWQRNILKDFKAKLPNWLVSESPLVDGNRVYVTPAGQDAGMVALDKMTGATIWKSERLGDEAAYSSIVVADVQGVRTLTTMTLEGGVGVRASDGKVMWKAPRPPTHSSNIDTPNFVDSKVLYGFDTGISLHGLTAQAGTVTATEIYVANGILGVEAGGLVILNGYVYGGVILSCADVKTGTRVWRDRSVGRPVLTYADGHLYLISQEFTVGLAEATPVGYKEKGRFTIADRGRPSYTPPVVSGGRLYIRNQGNLTAYDIKAK